MALTTVETGLSFITYTGDGAITDFNFTFGYEDPTEIKVQVNGSNITYTSGVAGAGQYSVSGQTVTRGSAGTAGDVVKIYRQSKNDARYVDYSAGSNLPASVLDKDSNQLFRIIQELIDGQATATGFLPAPGGNGTSQTNVITVSGDGTSGTDTGLELDNALFQVFVNGLRAHPSDYSVDGSVLTFNYGLPTDSIVMVEFLTAGGSITAIANGTVDTAQIATDAITADKIEDDAVEWSHLKDAAFDGDWDTIEATESPQGILENLNTRLVAVEAMNALSSGDLKITEVKIEGSSGVNTMTFTNGQPDYVVWIGPNFASGDQNMGIIAQGSTETISGQTVVLSGSVLSNSSTSQTFQYALALQEIA